MTPADVLEIPEHVIVLEIRATGRPAALRGVVERAADLLMENLLVAPDVYDPSVSMDSAGSDVGTEAWVCQECWDYAITEDVLRLALRMACHDGWSDGDGAMRSFLIAAQEVVEASIHIEATA